ncbi:zinc-binding alcohol dehydrogenase family protein [Phycisphaeraceae bacterium D3-23]
MKAIGLKQYLPIDNPDALIDFEQDRPVPTGRDLLVAIHAVAVNPVDYKVRAPQGGGPTDDRAEDPPRILGWDASGIVEAVGPHATLFKPGDAVYYAGDITRPGCNAEYQLVDERIVGPKPQSLSHAQAAALPLTTITAYEAFFDRLGIDRDGDSAGQSLLIIGGAGGVGSIGIQLAKHAKLRVIATASRPESVAWVKSLGADNVINHREPLRPQVEALGLQYVDHLALFNDTDGHWPAATDLIRPQGTIVSIVENQQPLAMDTLKAKAAALAWEFMFARSMFETPDMAEQHKLLAWVAQQIDAGKIQTTVAKVMTPIDAANLRQAHAELEAGSATGKIVLEGF